MPPTGQRLRTAGRGLHRPECVTVTHGGALAVADWRGGVTVIGPDGSQRTILARGAGLELRPNGVANAPGGGFLVAHLGDSGGVFRLALDGTRTPLVTEADGIPLPPTNYAAADARGRLWISVSTRHSPRQLAWRPTVADGFIVLADRRGARVVADGLHYTNEVRPDPSGEWLYAVETFGRRLSRFRILVDGSLGPRETVAVLGHGCFPDGFAFDEEGGIWLTSLVSNRVLRLGADGGVETMLDETNGEFVEEVEHAFAAGTMAAPHLGRIPGTTLQHVTSIAFGGPDRRTAWLGSLHGTCLYEFRAAVPGVALPPSGPLTLRAGGGQ